MILQKATVFTDLERALQESLDQKRRLAAIAPSERPVQPASPPTPGEWFGEERGTTVHGFATGSFVYAGNRLRSLNGRDVEPSLIDPALRVDPTDANTSGDDMTYWPSYSTISPASRRAFLQWLDGGRRDPSAYIGYVFIFFYGLERRVYEYVHEWASSAEEVLAIAREVGRLLEVYGNQSNSFASYAISFLDFIACIEPRAASLSRRFLVAGIGPSQRLKLTLGQLALAEKPIPADQALEWVRATSFLNTPAVRCAREFELLFHIRYAQQFGDGLVIKPNRTSIDIAYHPASGGLEPLVMRQKSMPNVTQLSRPLARLTALARECSAALDPFSRFLGKNSGGREQLAAFALLPEELVEAMPSADATSLASLVRSRLDEKGRAHLAAGELLLYIRLTKPGKVSKNEATQLAQALEKLGYGIEPDVRLGGPVYELDGQVVVFRRLPDCPSAASEDYAVAMLLMRLAAIVSAADDEVSQDERALLEQHIEERLQLTPGERQRLGAHLSWLLSAGLGMTGLKRRLDSLPRSARRQIGKVLVEVAATDGHVDPREVKILEKLYDLLDVPRADLYRDVHAAGSDDGEPIAVEVTGAGPSGYAIPPKPLPVTAAGVDMDRVRLKIAETHQVSALLSSIFVDEEPPPAVAQANTIGSLDAAHSELLRRLAGRESWPRDEVERLAGELSLLLDGALETINDYAYATANEPFWEDGDPVAINAAVARELIA